jgi:nicotinamidase/pyrazinamidase
MLEGPLVFVDVDTQRDFLEPGGALPVPGAAEILDNLARLTRFARDRGIPVLATACSHTPDDPELDHFPPHCMAGTPGQERVGATARPGGCLLGVAGKFEDDEDLPAHLTVEKREYDVFRHPEADRIAARYARDRPTFVVYGVATDYCVRAAALGLLERGHKVAVVVDAVRAIDRDREAEVFAELTRRGAVLTLTEVVCNAAGSAQT